MYLMSKFVSHPDGHLMSPVGSQVNQDRAELVSSMKVETQGMEPVYDLNGKDCEIHGFAFESPNGLTEVRYDIQEY